MKRLLLVFVLLSLCATVVKAQEPAITTCQGLQRFCLTQNTFDLCVEITLNSNFTDPIDFFEIDWGDGSPITTIPFSNNPVVPNHTYDFPTFFNTCDYEDKYFVTLTTFIIGAPSVANIIPVTFINPPQAMFSISPNSIICVGEEACFNDDSCPIEGLNIVSWNYGDGSPSSLEECHTYNQVGLYTITLQVENECGPDMITQQLQVINPAESNIAITSNNVDDTATPFIYCLGSGLVTLDGDSLSLNENYYEWQSLNSVPGASWVLPPMTPNDATPNIPDISVSFSQIGLYQLILEVNNECDQPDFDTLVIQVLSGEALTQPNQPDACLELIYTPDNFNPNATYTINGNIQTTFPITLGVGNYEVICSLANECGSQTTTDNFEVFDQEDVSIITPSDTLCIGGDSLQIFYTSFGGMWTGQHLKFFGDSVFFCPTVIGVFTLTYSKGIGDCENAESITITVEDSGITTIDHEVCSDSPPFPMGATGADGIYTSTDCPLCIQGDTFIISEMVALGLTMVSVNFSGASQSGCEGNNTFTVTLDDPDAMFIVDETFCIGDPIPIDISNTNGDLAWMINGQNVSPPPFNSTTLGAGIHTIKLTATSGDCDTMEVNTITIFSVPTDVSFTATPIEGCADLEVTLTNTTGSFDNESYEWYLDDSLFSTIKNPVPITLGPGFSDTIYTISLSAGNSCDGAIATQDITVFPRPVPRFGPMQNSYCSGDTVKFANVSFGGPMSSWSWNYGNGMTSTDSIPLDIIYFTATNPTTYTISLTATNDCGTEVFTYDIVINPTDVEAFFNIDPIEGCVGEEVCFTNLSTVGANVLWDFGDGNTSTQKDICHTYSSAGTYTIKLKAFGCGFDSTTFTVTIHPMPQAGFTNNTIVCPGDPLSFNNTSTLAQSFLWDFGDGDTSTLNNPSHTYSSFGNFPVTLYVTSNNGCMDSTFSLVNVLIPPAASFIVSTDSICVGDIITFTSTSTLAPLTCFWTFGDGATSSSCQPNHSYDSAGDYMVTLIITDNSGCRDTSQQLVNVAIVPTPLFDYSQNGDCSPVEILFNNQSTDGVSYDWNFGDGGMSLDENPSHTFNTGGNFTIELTAINGVCAATTSQIIDINQTPESEIIAPLIQSGCAPFVAPFSSSPTGNDFTYKWDFGDGSFSFDAAPSHTFFNPDTFLVILVVTDGPCADTAFTEMIAFEPVEATVNTIDNLCFGDAMGSIELAVTNGTPEYQYQWSNGGIMSTNSNLPAGFYNITITDDNACTWTESVEILQPENPIVIDVLDEKVVTCYGGSDGSITIAATGGTPSFNYLWETGSTLTSINNVPAGNYPITVTDINGCILEEVVTINQNDSIQYDATVNNISCFGYADGEILFENISGGIPDYFISMPQLDSIEGTAFSDLVEDSYTAILTDGVGCEQTFTANISEPSEVWIELDEDSVEIYLGEPFTIENNNNVANPIFAWVPPKGLDCTNCEVPTALPFVSSSYTVLMTDANGCFDSDTIFIKVIDERRIAVPNIFTPNNDGENDVFTLLGNNPAVTQITEFRIFDRYGGILFAASDFELNDPTFGWDGKFKGQDAQVGTYAYTAQVEYVDGRVIDWSGSLMLIR